MMGNIAVASKTLIFLKNFFFKFNSSFLSNVLEERLQTKKSFLQILYFAKKQIFFYLACFIVFCYLLLQTPEFLHKFLASFSAEKAPVNFGLKFASGVLLFVFVGYTLKILQSALTRNFDFLVARIQIASRYLMRSSAEFNYSQKSPSHFLFYILSCMSVVPLGLMFYLLYPYLHLWFCIPLVVAIATFVGVGVIKSKVEKLLSQTAECYKKDIHFFQLIEHYLQRVRLLAFDTILQKKVISFSGDSSPFYQKIFENEILVTGIKYSSVFLIFCLNAGLFLFTNTTYDFVSFLPVVVISTLMSFYFISFLKLFDYKIEAQSLYKFFKQLDTLRAEQNTHTSHKADEKDLDTIVAFKNASFVKDNQVIFHQMNHHLKKSKITTLVGSSAEERSNYLNACVGNLPQVGGHLQTPKHFEFLSKTSILFDGTIRENIVQFHDFDPDFYREVLKSCALAKEIDLLAEGDLTTVEQDSNQFAANFIRKIAIARIIYAQSAVNVFDDLFHDLSPYDAAQIYCEGIQKLLKEKTRIIATDKIEFAALSDEILVCKSGKIIEQGSHVSLLSYDSLYSRLFYSGAENKRYEILQSHSNFNHVQPTNPINKSYASEAKDESATKEILFGDQIFERFKKKADKFSHFIKMFFPVFVSKDFYAFFTFLTISVWGALYAFYFTFSSLSLSIVAKISIIFFAFSLIACVSFSVMLMFYKKVYGTCAYIVENVSKIYFANMLVHTDASYVDWKNEHILSVTGKFFKGLLNCLLVGFFCLGFTLIISVSAASFISIGLIGGAIALLFIHAMVRNQLVYDDENSLILNQKLFTLTKHFFAAYSETQSQNVRAHLLEKTHAKIYGLYSSKNADLSNSSIFYNVFGLRNLWQNYKIISDMILSVRAETKDFKTKKMSYAWPTTGNIAFENVKFLSDAESAATFVIPAHTKFLYADESSFVEKNIFIEKTRGFSDLFNGSIKIDNEDISQIPSETVLNQLGIVSQTSFIPFLSIREHVDPYGLCDDSEIWAVLSKVSLAHQVALLKYGLETSMEDLPEEMHWSGELVLFSFARCLINQNKIICIDDIDVSEDVENLVCQIVKIEFAKCTVLIATENEKFKALCSMSYPSLQTNEDRTIAKMPENDSNNDSYWQNKI